MFDTVTSSHRGSLVVVSGPSAVGKGTVLKGVLRNEKRLRWSISYTTRKPRKGEIHGVHYFFITEEDFREKISRNFFLEYAEVFGHLYGSSFQWIEEELRLGSSILLEIDCQGAHQIMRTAPEALTIFLLPPSWKELERRIRGRATDSDEVIRSRLDKATWEMAQADAFKHRVVNDDLEVVIGEVTSIIHCNLGIR